MSDTTTGKTCFYCNHPGAYLGMPEDEEVNICACCSWVDGHEKRSECFEHVERERDEARAEVERVRETLAETAARNWGRAQKADAALERVRAYAEILALPHADTQLSRRAEGENLLALIRNETDTKETP